MSYEFYCASTSSTVSGKLTVPTPQEHGMEKNVNTDKANRHLWLTLSINNRVIAIRSSSDVRVF